MKIIVGISGATGTILGKKLLETLNSLPEIETHLVISNGAAITENLELKTSLKSIIDLADHYHPIDDIAATIASGSFYTAGMIVIPCSMKTLAGIVSGYSDNLLLRAADVCIKEQRKLVLVTREMPLSQIHLENMLKASRLGAMIMPPMLTFYNNPQTIDDLIDHLVGKILMQFGLTTPKFKPWQGS